MLLLDEDGASTIPDNVSDVDETGLSGRGSASLDGRESPLSQARSQCPPDGQENEIGDLGAVSTVAGSENDVAQRVLPSGVPVAVRKQNAEGLEEKFGKFTVPTSQENSRDDQRSLLSDSWSTNVVPSDDEGTSLPVLPHLPCVDVAEGGNHRGRSVNRRTKYFSKKYMFNMFSTGSLCAAGTVPEDKSDTWSLDAIASDSEADGGRERGRHVPDDAYDVPRIEPNSNNEVPLLHIAVPCVSVQPLVSTPNHVENRTRLRRHSSGSSFSCSRSEADSEISRDDRERAAPSVLISASRVMTQKQPSSDQPGPSGACTSSFSSPSHSPAVGNSHDGQYDTPSSPSNNGRRKFALFQQGLQKVGDKVRKGMTASSFRQIPHSSTISDILNIAQRSADDILAKYQPAAAPYATEVPIELASSASESAPSEQVIAYYSPDNVTECSFSTVQEKLPFIVLVCLISGKN
uniref:PI3K/PI4K domain-containing protein n=1 Tax=Angiostrongylus cantonensis TaxID=6313 RepID=A0A0K0D4W4_ANGCA